MPAGVHLPPEYRTWRLVQITGMSVDQIDDTAAFTLDWFLQFHALEEEMRERAERDRQRDMERRA